MTEQNMYDAGLGKTPANFEALTPLSFLGRAARVFGARRHAHGRLDAGRGRTVGPEFIA